MWTITSPCVIGNVAVTFSKVERCLVDHADDSEVDVESQSIRTQVAEKHYDAHSESH